MTPAAAMVLVINTFYEPGYVAASERTLHYFRQDYMQHCVDRARLDCALRRVPSAEAVARIDAAQTYLDSITVLVMQPQGDTTTMATKKKTAAARKTTRAPSAALTDPAIAGVQAAEAGAQAAQDLISRTPAELVVPPVPAVVPPAAESSTGKLVLTPDQEKAVVSMGARGGLPVASDLADQLQRLGLILASGTDPKAGTLYALTDAGKKEKQRAKWREEARKDREKKTGKPATKTAKPAARPAVAPTPAKGLVAKPTSITALARAVDDAQAALDQARATLRKAIG